MVFDLIAVEKNTYMLRKKMKRKYAFSRACGDYLSPERKKVYRTTYSDCGVDRVQKKKKKSSEREPHRRGCYSVVEVYVVYLVYDIDRNVVVFVVGKGEERTRRLRYDLITYMEATGWLSVGWVVVEVIV